MSSRRIYPIEVIEGEDKSFELTLTRVDGSPYNLAGCTLTSEVRDEADTLICTLYPIVENPVTGLVRLSVVGNGTIGKAGDYQWDLKISSGLGIDYLDASRFRVRRSITNS